MAKTVEIKILGGQKYKASVAAVFRKAINKSTLDEIGGQVVELNRKSIRQGKNPNSGESFPALSPEWIKRRNRIAPRNELAEFYRPRKSNLTFSGQLLDALHYKSDTSDRSVTVKFLDSRRKPYRGVKNNELKGRGLTNKKLAGYISERIGEFIGLTEQMEKRVTSIIERRVRSLLRLFK